MSNVTRGGDNGEDRWPPLPKLTDDERERVNALFDQFIGERDARVDAYIAKLRRRAFQLGCDVAARRVTQADAERRLDRLCGDQDPECPVPLYLVPWRDAWAIAIESFGDGVRDGRRAR